MDEASSRRTLYVVAGLVVGGAILAGLTTLGGQTSRILSTVGSSVNTSSNGGGSDVQPALTTEPATGDQFADAARAVPTLLIVRTGELVIQVPDLVAALRDGDGVVLRVGGYVSGSSRSSEAGRDSAQVTYRIPSAAWSTTLEALRGLGSTVVTEQIKTEEVSGQVIDLTARIANLRATEAALQAIMAKAAKISDVLDVQEQLTATRGEIEKLVAEKAHLEDQSSYGSLGVTYRLPVVPAPSRTPVAPKGWDPGDDVARASGKLVGIGQTTTSIGIWLAIVGLPVAIGGLVLLVTIWQAARLVRWVLRRRAAMLPEA